MEIIKNTFLMSMLLVVQNTYGMDSSIFGNVTTWTQFDQELSMRINTTKNPIAKAHLAQQAYSPHIQNKLWEIETIRSNGKNVSSLITDLLNSIDPKGMKRKARKMKREASLKKRLKIDRYRRLILPGQQNIHRSSTEKILFSPIKDSPWQ